MGWAEYTPVLVYGVKAKDDEFIHEGILQKYDVDIFALGTTKGFGLDPIYGVVCKLEEYKTGCVNADDVDKFIQAAKKRGIDFSEPGFHLVLDGYVEWDCPAVEWPESDEESENEKDE